MNDFSNESKAQPSETPSPGEQELAPEINWVDMGEQETSPALSSSPAYTQEHKTPSPGNQATLVMVETAFLASTASLIWLINYYFPVGPLLKVFFPVPMALVYLRRGVRASWMAALVSGLLLSVLMGPTRSIVFVMPYGFLGVHLGWCWRRGVGWGFSIPTGAIIGSFGFFFRFWLFSILLGEDLWLYVITQITELAEWIFIKLGLLTQPSLFLIEILAVITIVVNSLIYLLAVHLVSLLVLDRLGNPISRPPRWIGAIIDYD